VTKYGGWINSKELMLLEEALRMACRDVNYFSCPDLAKHKCCGDWCDTCELGGEQKTQKTMEHYIKEAKKDHKK